MFVFTTYDGASQAVLPEVDRFARHNQDILVIGVVTQPDASTFARLFSETVQPSFTVAYEESPRIVSGTSDLGDIGEVPAFVFLDGEGYLLRRRSGWISERELLRLSE